MARNVLTVAALAVIVVCRPPYSVFAAPANTPSLRSPQGVTKPVASVAQSPVSNQRALLDRYCVTCHNERLKTAGLSLAGLDVSQVSKDAAVWEKVVRKLRGGLMPPAGVPRPDETTYDGLVTWLENELDSAAAAHLNPGRTEALHRLSRTEYHNAVRDLLALEVDTSAMLPPDDQSFGFDNIAGVLGLSPALLDRYVAAARKVSRLAVGAPVRSAVAETFRVRSDLPQGNRIEGAPFGTRGGSVIRYNFPVDAEYLIALDVSGAADQHQIAVILDGEVVREFTLDRRAERRRSAAAGMGKPAPLEARVPVKAGPRTLVVTFVMKTFAEVESLRQPFLRPYGGTPEPRLDAVTITGPFAAGDAPQVDGTASRRRIFVCRPESRREEDACAAKIVRTLARRAFRRPVRDAELTGLIAFFEDGRNRGGFEAGIESALRRLLTSPEFLFRIERDPADVPPNGAYRISDLELASRLSFFLWSSIPDDELLDVAEKGRLRDPAILRHQVHRLLADERAGTLVTSFAAQWLTLRKLEAVTPDQYLFPDFDEGLRQGLRRETELFVESILREDRSVLELLTADYTFVNERLARHYGIPNVYGDHFRRVTVPKGSPRGGLLGQGSILTVTSYANRTSPVLRGKWILENVLGTPPPPPPPDVPDLKDKNEAGKVLSMRDRMAAHRSNPVCASCHKMMDPLGLSLEQFDAVGLWRTRDESGATIDASGGLPDGLTAFTGAVGLREALLTRSRQFVTNFTEKLLTYAIGRGVDYYDAPAIRRIVRGTADDNYRLSSLILGIVNSAPFQMRAALPASERVAN
jgi:mono/diheme cytochrome c family protein